LQVLDDGRLTDSQGRVVDFKNAVVIMTSNVAPGALRTTFRPEFLNRIDDVVLFRPLALEEIERIVDLLTEELRRRLGERGVRLELTDAARALAARMGFDPVFGARPLRRTLQHEVESRVGRALIAGDVPEGGAVRVDAKDGALVVTIAAKTG
jgi:ATP-dependent Clp protease ATP-binding subunit ClpB